MCFHSYSDTLPGCQVKHRVLEDNPMAKINVAKRGMYFSPSSRSFHLFMVDEKGFVYRVKEDFKSEPLARGMGLVLGSTDSTYVEKLTLKEKNKFIGLTMEGKINFI